MGASNSSILATASWWIHAKQTFTSPGFQNASKQFVPGDLDVSLKGKVFVVTGANSGLGFSIAKSLAERQGKVVILCRNKERGEKARQLICSQTKNENVVLEIVDVARPNELKAFARRFVASGERLDALINNAGAMFHQRGDTPEGYENTFALHTLGVFLLTEYLLPSLQRTVPPGRVITMTSGGLYTQAMNAKNFQTPLKEFKGDGLNGDGAQVYAQCKRHQLYMTQFWGTKKYANTGVFFACTHPGWARTEGTKDALPKWFDEMPLRTVEEGADCAVWLAVVQRPEVLKQNGLFWFDREVAQTDFGGVLAGTKSSPSDIAKLQTYLEECKQNCEFEDAPDAKNSSSSSSNSIVGSAQV